MKKLLFTCILLLTAVIFTPPSLALDSTPDPGEEVTENLKERLKSAVNGAEVNEVQEEVSLRSFVGKVVDVIQNTIILEDKEGKKSVKVSNDATLVRSPGNAEIEIDSIRLDDSIIAIGELIAPEELNGKRIIVSSQEFSPPKKLAGLGMISKINRYSFILTDTDQGETFELFFTGKTVYKSPSDLLQFDNLSVGDEILYTAIIDKDGDWSATIVMQIKPAPAPSPSPSPAN